MEDDNTDDLPEAIIERLRGLLHQLTGLLIRMLREQLGEVDLDVGRVKGFKVE